MALRETAAQIFRKIRKGQKPLLDRKDPVHRTVIKTLENMDAAHMLDGNAKIYYRDFSLAGKLTPEQDVRLESFTAIQPFTNALADTQRDIETILDGVNTKFDFIGRDPFTRNGNTRHQINPFTPTLIGEGGLYEAECLDRALQKRTKNASAPLFVYNPNGIWDELLLQAPTSALTASNVHICTTPESLREAVQKYENIRFLGAGKPKETASHFNITSDEPRLYNISNNAEKRAQSAIVAISKNTAFRIYFIGDQTLNLVNNDEITATGAGNGKGKMVDAILHFQGSRMRRQMEGHTPKDMYGMASDITMECNDARLAKHPVMEKYAHVLKAGQNFPGSEMANAEKTTDIDTLMADVHKAYDELGIPEANRKITIKTVNYLFPLDQKLGQNATDADVKYVCASASQTYLLRRAPLPLNRHGNETYAYVTLENEPHTSQREYFLQNGVMHPQSHLTKVWETLEHMIAMPTRPLDKPYVAKPKLANPAQIVTSAHFTGEWSGNPADHFTRTALQDLESKGYTFADTWNGGQGLLDLERFRQNRDAFIILPPQYDNKNDSEAVLKTKLDHMTFAISLWVDLELSDPYVRGRPIINYDNNFSRLVSTTYRLGFGALPADKGAILANSADNLGDMLDKGWKRYEYSHDAHIPYWEEDPKIPAFTKANVVALLGSAKTQNLDKLTNSTNLARAFHEMGWAVSDGHGGEGDMGAFAMGAVLAMQTRDDVERFGVTTPLTAIEKRPICLNGTPHEHRFVSERDIYRRMERGILRADANIAVAGGDGTVQEIHVAARKTVNGADTINIIDSNPVIKRGHAIKPFAAYSRLFSEWEKSRMNLVEAASIGEMTERATDFVASRIRPALRA